MPCHTNTDNEDRQWAGEILRHHRVIETILEKCIATGETSWASGEYQEERQVFAKNYARIFKGLFSPARLQDGVENILQSGNPYKY